MNKEVVLPWLDLGIKYAVLMFSNYYLFMRCVSEKRDNKKIVYALFFSAAMGISLIWLRNKIDPMHLPLMLVYTTVTNCLLYRNEISGEPHGESRQGRLKLSDIVVLSLLCFAFCEALFMLVGFVASVLLSIFYYNLMPESHNSVWDFLNDTPVHVASYIVMITLVWVVTYLSARVRRLRRGLLSIVERRRSGTVIMVALLMLMVVMSFGSRGATDTSSSEAKTALLIPAMVFCVAMIVLTQREIKSDHCMKIRERNLLLLEGSLSEKDKEIAGLVKDNENLAGIIRRDSELLATLSDGLKKGADSDEITREAETVEKLYAGRCEAVSLLENHGRKVTETGVNSVDAILCYMAYLAEGRGIDFEVNVQSDMNGVIGEKINRREFNTILADLTENAIISAGAVKERHVEVMLLRNNENFRLEVLDSGERFDVGVLKNMGKKRITTHSGEGGSGIGMMTLFNILRETGASFAIEEFAEGAKYHKAVSVTFDGARKFRIITDRAEELKQALRSDRFAIEKR